MPPFEPPGEPPAAETEKERKKREKRERKEAKKRAKEAENAPAGAPGPAPAKKKKKKKKKKKNEEDDEEELERLKAAMNDESGELEASEEELLEELQTDCAVRVQKQARALKARRQVRNMIKTTFAKEYDQENDRMVYRNKVTGLVQRTKPRLLRDEDLPDPVVYVAPDDYKVEPADRKQFALVLTTTSFNDEERLPPLPAVVENDHDAIRKHLVNPYVCKYAEEDCLFLKNVSKNVFLTQIDALRDIVRKANQSEKLRTGAGREFKPTGSLLVYVATHVATHRSGGPYFCFSDTSAVSNSSLNRTGMKVSQFCKLIRDIKCREKTVILDCCHVERPPSKEAAKRPVVVYPPSTFYSDVAYKAECRVLGSCKLGGEGRPPEFGEQPPKAVLDQPVLVDRREDGTYHKGIVASCNEDGTYDVTFADEDLQHNIPRYLLRPRTKEDLAAEAEELRRAELLEKLQRSMKVTTLTSKFIKKTQVAALTTRQRVEAPVPAAAPAPAEAPAPAPAPSDDELCIDQRVEARYHGSDQYYKGVVTGVHADCTYDVTYEDGECERNIPRDAIRVVEVQDEAEAPPSPILEEPLKEEVSVVSYEEPRLSLYARICDKLRCCPKMQVNQDDPRNIIVTDEVEQLYARRWCCCEWVSSTLSLLPCWCCWSQAKKARKRARKEEKLRIKREGLAKAAASYERALYVEEHSLFGGAVVKALTEAAETDERRVSVESVYNTITKIVAQDIEKRRQVQALDQQKKDQADDDEEKRLLEVSQRASLDDRPLTAEEPEDTTNYEELSTSTLQSIKDPPKDNKATQRKKAEEAKERQQQAKEIRKARQQAIKELAQFRVERKQKLPDALVSQTPQCESSSKCVKQYTTLAMAPALPPAPEPPIAIKTRARSALLQWQDPPFSGTAPVQYDVQSMGTAKFDSGKWAKCGAFTYIARNEFQAPHLVPGMAVYFRVRARNNSGWGAWSQSSEKILPVANKLVGLTEAFEEAARRGAPYVLQKMKAAPTVAEAQKLGALQLGAIATKARGFKRKKVASECATLMLKAMRTFEVEKEVQSRGCLVLGWCFFRHADVAKKCYEEALQCVEAAAQQFPEDVSVQSYANWALAHLSEAEDDRPSTVGSPGKTFSQLGTPGKFSSLGTPGKFSQLSTPGRTTPGKFSQLSSPGREKLALSPAIDPDIEAYAQWLEDKITREAENVGFLEGRGHSPYKS